MPLFMKGLLVLIGAIALLGIVIYIFREFLFTADWTIQFLCVVIMGVVISLVSRFSKK